MSYKFGPPLMVLGKPYTRLLDRDGKSPDADVWFDKIPPDLWIRNIQRIYAGFVRFEFKADDGQLFNGRTSL
jgi:hypothetical protein